MTTIRFTVPCVPVAQPRQRTTVRNGFAANYTPTDHPVNAYKAAVKAAAQEAYSGPPLRGPLWLSAVFVLPRVKPEWVKKHTSPHWFAEWKAGRRVPAASNRNDRDNLLKSTQDAMNKLTYADDGLIVDGPVAKWIAAANEQPHVEIEIQELTQ